MISSYIIVKNGLIEVKRFAEDRLMREMTNIQQIELV